MDIDSFHCKQLHRYEHAGQARFLTFSCYGRRSLFGNDAIKDAFVEHLGGVRDAGGFRLLGYVVMPEHVHLLILPDLPSRSVTDAMRRLKGPFAFRVIQRWRELGASIIGELTDSRGVCRFWQAGGGHDRNVRGPDELVVKLNYLHQNPVKRGLVGRSAGWRWSSAAWYAGERGTGLRIDVVE